MVPESTVLALEAPLLSFERLFSLRKGIVPLVVTEDSLRRNFRDSLRRLRCPEPGDTSFFRGEDLGDSALPVEGEAFTVFIGKDSFCFLRRTDNRRSDKLLCYYLVGTEVPISFFLASRGMLVVLRRKKRDERTGDSEKLFALSTS